ncbi:MAG: type II secretion system F family protein, partial [Evtepia sp.]
MNHSPTLSADRISVFCYQLALMQKAGIGFEESMSLLLSESKSDEEKKLYSLLSKTLNEGASFSNALALTGVFPQYMIRMVEIGQVSGRTEQVFSALSDYYKREASTQSTLRRVVAYPAFMGVLIAVIFLVLLVKVLPVFDGVLRQLGVSLSPFAQALLKFGASGRVIAAIFAVLIAAFVCAAFFLLRATGSASPLDRFVFLKNTAAARALRKSRFASSMSLMLSSGLPLDESLLRTEQLLEQTPLAPKLSLCRTAMESGKSFPDAVEEADILDHFQLGLLRAGFRGGDSDDAMSELSR